MANSDSVYTPGGAGGLQGLRTYKKAEAYYDPMETKGSSIKQGDETRTRITGGLGHQIFSSLTSAAPSSYYSNKSKPQDG